MTANVHATAVAVGNTGILIRGASGSGKSSLAFALIDRVRLGGGHAVFVSDDRVDLAIVDGRLEASAPVAIAGLAERYGAGIERVDFVASAAVGLVVDLVEDTAFRRMPEPEELVAHIEGIDLPRQPVPARRSEESVRLVLAALDRNHLS